LKESILFTNNKVNMILETKNEKLGIRTRNKIVSLKEIEQRKRVFAKLIARFDNNLRIEFIQNKKNSNEDKLEMIESLSFSDKLLIIQKGQCNRSIMKKIVGNNKELIKFSKKSKWNRFIERILP
jgi:hypothetical protein